MTETLIKKRKILIAEDDDQSAELLKMILERAGYSPDVVYNGKKAYSAIKEKKYDVLLTDWMMPQMDGIELIRKVRENIPNPPVIIVITALSSQDARKHALNSGADDFLAKPYKPKDILEKVEDLFSIIEQKLPKAVPLSPIVSDENPPFTGICIAASSGGPQAVFKIISSIPFLRESAVFIVQHGPQWALQDMAFNWNRYCKMEVKLGSHGAKIRPGNIYLAPGKCHMIIEQGPLQINLVDGPPENFVKPAADPLFRSVAKCFGRFSVSVVLSGMGCDGALGSLHISAASGVVIAQSPETSLVKFMPMTAMETVPDALCIPLDKISDAIVKYSTEQSKKLNN
ncbi:MAG: chemotaxis protein CheB [Spirochaetes bacterium]|nr:chemotaxis protein CheB [Spirochaetota bacterium]